MKCIEIANKLIAIYGDEWLIKDFSRRVQFRNVLDIQKTDLKVMLKVVKVLNRTIPISSGIYEPVFDETGFSRNILGICELYFVARENTIFVNYINCHSKDNREIIVDATLQFVSLSMLYLDILPFHGALVISNGCGIILAGQSGAGKSTLEFSLVNAGMKFFSDDIFFLGNDGWIYNNGEYIMGLREDAINKLRISSDFFRERVSGGKRIIDMRMKAYSDHRVKVKYIFFPLGGNQKKGHSIIQLSREETIIKLLELTISEKLPSEFKHKYFKSLSRLVKTLKSYEIKRSLSCDDFETEQICKDILRIVK